MKKLFILISLGFWALSGNAFADGDNYTAFNGTGCDNYFAGDTGQFNHQYNGINNVSVGAKWVSCPIDKDNVASTLGTGTTWVHFRGNGTMSCYLVGLGYNAEWGGYQPGSGTDTNSANGTWFSIPPLAFDNFWGSQTMYCLVPAGATLETIHVFEN
jgi:hypothetical protein